MRLFGLKIEYASKIHVLPIFCVILRTWCVVIRGNVNSHDFVGRDQSCLPTETTLRAAWPPFASE